MKCLQSLPTALALLGLSACSGCAQAVLAAALATGGGGSSGGGQAGAVLAPQAEPPLVAMALSPREGSALGGERIVAEVFLVSFVESPRIEVEGVSVAVERIDDTRVAFSVPPNTDGNVGATAQVTLRTPQFRSNTIYLYRQVAPTLSSLSPTQARVGDEVIVTGVGFIPNMRVRFGALESQRVSYESPSRLRVAVPEGARGVQSITALMPNGQLESEPLVDAIEVLPHTDSSTAPPTYTISSSVPATVAAGLTFPIEVSVLENGGVSAINTQLTLTVRDGATAVFGPTTASTGPTGRASWNLSLSAERAYQAEVRGSWSGPEVTESIGSLTIVPRYRFSEAPSDPSAGALGVVKVAQWGIGGPDASASGNVTLRLFGNDGSVTLGGTLTQALVGGEATFSNLSLTKAASRYRLRARFSASGSEADHDLRVVPGPGVALTFTSGTPARRDATRALSPFVEVGVVDAHGNLVRSSSATVQLSLDANPASAILGGTATRPAVQGLAHFDDVSVSAAASGLTLRATSVGLSDATLALNVAGPPLELVSVTASDGVVSQAGIDGDDVVTVVFNQPTNRPVLTATNIDEALIASPWTFNKERDNVSSNLFPQHSFKSVDGSLGGASWSADGRTLTIQLSASGGAPTLEVSNRIALGSVIRSASGGSGAESRGFLSGSFGGGIALRSIEPCLLTSQMEVRLRGEGFSSVPSNNTVTIGGQSATVLAASENELRVRLGDLSSTGASVTVGPASASLFTQNTPVTPRGCATDLFSPRAPRICSSSRDSIFNASIAPARNLTVVSRLGGASQSFASASTTATVDMGDEGWVAFGTLPAPGGLRGDAIYVSRWVDSTTISPNQELASLDSGGTPLAVKCSNPAISNDGRYVYFEVDALPPGMESAVAGPYLLVRDRNSSTTSAASRDPAGNIVSGRAAEVSPDGRFLVYLSDQDLVDSDTNGRQDAYLWDRVSGRTTLLSTDGASGGLGSRATLAESGRVATYERGGNIYLLDRTVASGAALEIAQATEPSLSADGRYLAFVSARSDLLVGWPFPDNNAQVDAFRKDRQTDQIDPMSTRVDRLWVGSSGVDQLELAASGRFAFLRRSGLVQLVAPQR